MNQRNVILQGDVRARLRELPDESVHMCVTSPPYWSLRDYGVEPQIWGGDPECDHDWRGIMRQAERYTGKRKWQHIGEEAQANGVKVRHVDENAWGHPQKEDTSTCSLCGAWRGALGLEPTPELYTEHIVEIFREVRRVMRKDATLWLNLGDSYASHDPGGYRAGEFLNPGGRPPTKEGVHRNRAGAYRPGGLKPKDLVGIPWRVAFALQADGWHLRSDIIWSKTNPMPESVKDRPTRSHEYLFLLSKSRRYYYDAEAIKEKASPVTLARVSQASLNKQEGGFKQEQYEQDFPGRKRRDRKPATILKHMARTGVGVATRNRRTVWQIATKPYKEAHFATYAPKLIEPCILAGTSEHGVCSACGAPWQRVVERGLTAHDGETESAYKKGSNANRLSKMRQAARARGGEYVNEASTLSWVPTCTHEASPVAGIVFDPFMGSGTTGLVASKLGRDYLGIELNADYVAMSEKRLAQRRLA